MITRILLFCFACCAAVAGTFNRQPAGLIKGARLTWVSGTTIKVGVGYGENAGEYWEIAPADTYNTTGFALTGLTATTNGVFQYIYIDKANSLFPSVTLVNSITAPGWSDTYMGWYNGQNRCIGAVWVKADVTIARFVCAADDEYQCITGTLAPQNGVSSTWGVWNVWDTSSLIPANACAVYGHCNANSTYPNLWTYCTAGLRTESGIGAERYEYSSITADLTVWLPLSRNSARQLSWLAFAETSIGAAVIRVCGYRIER